MPQRAIAEALQVSIAYIHQLETGKVPPPSHERCRQLAWALKTDSDDLWRRACLEKVRKVMGDTDIAPDKTKFVSAYGNEIALIELVRALDADTSRKFKKALGRLLTNHPDEKLAELLDKYIRS